MLPNLLCTRKMIQCMWHTPYFGTFMDFHGNLEGLSMSIYCRKPTKYFFFPINHGNCQKLDVNKPDSSPLPPTNACEIYDPSGCFRHPSHPRPETTATTSRVFRGRYFSRRNGLTMVGLRLVQTWVAFSKPNLLLGNHEVKRNLNTMRYDILKSCGTWLSDKFTH